MDNKYLIYGGIFLLAIIGIGSAIIYFGAPGGYTGKFTGTVGVNYVTPAKIYETTAYTLLDNRVNPRPDPKLYDYLKSEDWKFANYSVCNTRYSYSIGNPTVFEFKTTDQLRSFSGKLLQFKAFVYNSNSKYNIYCAQSLHNLQTASTSLRITIGSNIVMNNNAKPYYSYALPSACTGSSSVFVMFERLTPNCLSFDYIQVGK